MILEKIQGRTIISKLRIIQLLEADFNAVIKKIGLQIMQHESLNQGLGTEIHGGRPNRTAHDSIIPQKLVVDISKQKQTPYSIINLDASKLFDFLFPNISTIEMRRMGVPKPCAISLATKLAKMSHKVRTAHGTSPESISPGPEEIWNGVGQGSGASSPIWLFTEAVMLKAFSQYSSGAQISNPVTKEKFSARVVGYIDDNNLVRNGKDKNFQQESIKELVAMNISLKFSGGELTKEKCEYFSKKWTWTN